ncbi:MAG: PA2169 family four-helix-bundle protein [Balneolales bacterium]
MDNASIVSIISRLIETCKDGQEGFRTASEDVEDSNLKSLFSSYSLQRSEFAGELQDVLLNMGEKNPEDKSSYTGALHRGWINLKQALAGKERQAILAECERGEKAAVSEYESALQEDLPATVRATVEKQHSEVKTSLNRIRELREIAQAAE